MRITSDEVRRFAEASGDCNPIHVVPEVGRRTHFGGRIVHGMLSVGRALAESGLLNESLGTLDIEFRGAVFPDRDYRVDVVRDGAESALTVSGDGQVLLTARTGGARPAAQDTRPEWAGTEAATRAPRAAPAACEWPQLAAGREVVGAYPRGATPVLGPDTPPHARLAGDVLALCSYVIGMEVPGLRSLFTRAELAWHASESDSHALRYRAVVRRADPRFRMLDIELHVASDAGTPLATCRLRAYARLSPIEIDPARLGQFLGTGVPLEGKVAFVTGASRGLGADIVASLAVAGARVFGSYRHDRQGADAVDAALAGVGRSVTWLAGDAGDPDWAATALHAIREAAGRLDVMVLNACAPPFGSGAPDGAAAGFQRYVADNLRLVEAPVAAALPLLAESRGNIVYISSSYVSEPPPRLGHYVALKRAGETLIESVGREHPSLTTLILRPPPLQTAWNDTPATVAGTIPSEWVALALVDALRDGPGAGSRVVSTFDEPRAAVEAQLLPSDAPVLPLRLAASFTAEPIERGLLFWSRELGRRPDLWFAPYSQVLQTLLDPTSRFSTAQGGLNVVLLRLQDLLRELPAERREDPAFVEAHVGRAVDDLVEAFRAHRQQARAKTLLLLCPGSASLAGSLVAQHLVHGEQRLAEGLAGVAGLRVAHAAAFHAAYRMADASLDDPLREKIAHVPYKDAYLDFLATVVVRLGFAQLQPQKKVVVVDCDNTLWKGVVGEVGAEGVSFDEGHLALHDTLVRLSENGVVICLCTKNVEDDVWRVFDSRPEMRLRREHIVAAAINWQPKSENIRGLAERLNLGLDSFVFLDDNPVECEEVRSACPEVLTVQWPLDAAEAQALLAHTWELDLQPGTAEDRERTRMYKEEIGRQELRQRAGSFRDFLASLQLDVDIRPLSDEDLPRASQLTMRTNQFNFTTRRRDEGELRVLREAGDEIRTVRVKDRFGDYGLVGLVIARPEGDALDTDTFLMSCRVLGRGAEHRMAAELGRIAQARGLATVHMHVEPTKRNAPARDFLATVAAIGTDTSTGDRPACEIPAEALAEFRYEPGEAPPEEEAAETTATTAAPSGAASQGIDTRRREAEIHRTVFDLGTGRDLARAISGVREAGGPAPDAEDVGAAVVDAFARSLRRSRDEITTVDSLEALGCDSFRIVEITVDLVERFPWLPSTLLFEHRTVHEIVEHIQRIAREGGEAPLPTGAAAGPATGPATRADIAVVGIDLRTAGADSPAELWRLLTEARVLTRAVPRRRRFFFGPLDDMRGHWAGLLDDVDGFDAGFFGISPREAELMDPQLRLLLQVAWGALEDANAVAGGVDPDTGVFIGAMYDDYAHHANKLTRHSPTPYKSWESFSLANRVSQALGLNGPSLTVDTACSSSGVALHLACRALAHGECATAIVGGVNLILDPDRFVQLGRLGILSSKGRCLAFGGDADGTLLGEGIGVVVLRRLDEALARHDRIYGVIKGTGISTGSGTVGFTAPNPRAQAIAIRRALAASNVDPGSIAYVETHGTGTLLGDPIEVRGLTLAYDRAAQTGTDVCRIGSIKPNIGHLEAGAAVLGLIKVLLQLHHRTFVPSVTSETLNPQIPFGEIPFRVQTTVEPWEAASSTPRRAALSSFGVGGANVHVVIEESPASTSRTRTEPDATRDTHLVPLSARSEAALRNQARRLRAHLDGDSGAGLADVARTLGTTRRAFDHRAAIVASDRDTLLAALAALEAGASHPALTSGHAVQEGGPVGFLFTGQGSQYVGMGRALYEREPVFRAALDECAAELDPLLDAPLLTVMFEEATLDGLARIDCTRYTQPALFALQYALARLWESWGVRPSAVVGHSIGEFAAMCVAGGLSLADAARLVEARGRLMQSLPAGGVMVSVDADEPRVRAALTDHEHQAAIAGLNSPEQTVVSGAADAVSDVVARLAADGVRTKPLVVSHAFHSPLMRPMIDAFAEVAASATLRVPGVRVVSSVEPSLDGGALATPEYWVRQILEPVRFAQAITAMHEAGIGTFIEIGPQPVLIGLGRRTLKAGDGKATWIPSLKRGADDTATVMAGAAQVFVSGGVLDWHGLAPGATPRSELPRYAFDTRRHWVAVPEGYGRAVTDTEADGRPMREVGTYEINWRPAAPPATADSTSPGTWLVVAESAPAAAALTAALETRGARAVTVATTGRRRTAALREAVARHPDLHGIVLLGGLDSASDSDIAPALEDWTERYLAPALDVFKETAGSAGPRLWIVTHSAVAASTSVSDGDRPLALAQAALWGFGRTLGLEYPERWGGLVDLSGPSPAAEDVAALADLLLHERLEDQVAIRGGARLVPRLAPAEFAGPSRPWSAGTGAYVITGGMGALGLQVARWLVDRGVRELVLTGRQHRSEDAIAPLRAAGAKVSVVLADVSQPDDVDALFAHVAASGSTIRGIVHAAGVDRILPVDRLTGSDLRDVLAAKVGGAWLLHSRTRGLDLDLFLCFSSLSSVVGAAGRAAYAAANAYLDALVVERRREGLPGLSVSWGPWDGTGMAADPATRRQFEAVGNFPLEPALALDTLGEILDANLRNPHAVVASVDWSVFRSALAARRPRPILDEVARRAAPEDSPAASELLTALSPADVERLVREQVAQVLGFSSAGDVPLERSLFDLGMDSLSSVELVARLDQRFGIASHGFVFDTPTVAALCKAIASVRAGADETPTPVTAVAAPALSHMTEDTVTKPATAPTTTATASPAGIVTFTPGLEEELFAFHAEAYPRRRADWVKPRWHWMFADSARRLGREPLVWLYRDGSRVVAHNGAIPVRLHLNAANPASGVRPPASGGATQSSGPYETAWLVDTSVLADYRSHALGPRLMAAAHEGLPFALSLGQTETMRAIQLQMGWVQVAPLQTAQILIRPGRVLKGKLPGPAALAAGLGWSAWSSMRKLGQAAPALALRETERFDERHDALWASMARDLRCAVVRDASYLNWKYVDQPGQDFLRFNVIKAGTVVGAAIWMLRDPDDAYAYRRAHLVDLVAPLSDSALVRDIIQAGLAHMEARGADAAVCLHVSDELGAALRACGFMMREPGRFLLVYPGRLDDATFTALRDPAGWFVTQGDSDIDRPW